MRERENDSDIAALRSDRLPGVLPHTENFPLLTLFFFANHQILPLNSSPAIARLPLRACVIGNVGTVPPPAPLPFAGVHPFERVRTSRRGLKRTCQAHAAPYAATYPWYKAVPVRHAKAFVMCVMRGAVDYQNSQL